MPKYDFHKLLEPYEFQYLVRDILQIKENCFFESFSPGKDEGIDLRKTKNDNSIIVQIKRYKNDFNQFLTSLEKYELPKVKKLKPKRYMIVTSVTITETQKKKVLELFKDFIHSPEDILGETDLNNLLGQKEYSLVEINYPNLWFNSANTFLEQMDHVINSSVYEASRAEMENIKEMMSYFVTPIHFGNIIKTLNEQRYLLITGNPGIGKTSMARAICAYFIQKDGYQFVYTRHVENANKVYRPGQKQIFFFDDFWGSCFKDNDYRSSDERDLKEFIEKVEKSSNKILILTSKDYVLKQGLLKYLDLEEPFRKNQFLLELKDYSLKLRTDILLHHLYKANLKYHYLEHILYHAEKIVRHRNFNPRIIEDYLNSGFDLETSKYKYYEWFIESLDNPIEFLDKIYKRQTKEAQLVLYLLLSVEGSILFEELKELYLKVLKYSQNNGILFSEYNLSNIITQLEKNFIKTKSIENCGILIEFVNPSIIDFLYEEHDHFLEFDSIVVGAILYFNQIEFFTDPKNFIFLHTEKLKREVWEKVLKDFDELRLIRGDFLDTIPFEKMSNEEHMVYKLNRLFRIENVPLEVKDLAIQQFSKVLETLQNHNRKYIMKEDLASFINLIKNVLPYQPLDGLEMIELYYTNCQFTYELYLINEFQEIFPQEYQEFRKKNNKVLEQKLKQMIYNDVDYFYTHEMYQSLSELLVLLENDLFYLVKDDEELKEEIQFYDAIPDSYYEWQDKLLELDNDYKVNEDIKDVVAYCFHFFNIDYLENEDYSISELANNALSKEENEKLSSILEEDKWDYLSTFFYSKNGMELLVDYYKKFKGFPDRLTDFCYHLIHFVLLEEHLNVMQSFGDIISIGMETLYKNELVFSRETFVNSNFAIDIQNENIENLLNSKLFIKNGKWIKFACPILHDYCVSYAISLLPSKEKEEIYGNILFSISPMNMISFAFEYEVTNLSECLIEIDPKGFNENYLTVLLQHFLNAIHTDTEKTIVLDVLKFFEFTLYLDTLNYKSIINCGCSFIYPEIYELMEFLFGYFYVEEFVSLEAFIDFKKQFRKYIKSGVHEKYAIEVSDLLKEEDFYKWLEKHGLKEKILDFYYQVKQLSLLCKNHYLESFLEYAHLLAANKTTKEECVA